MCLEKGEAAEIARNASGPLLRLDSHTRGNFIFDACMLSKNVYSSFHFDFSTYSSGLAILLLDRVQSRFARRIRHQLWLFHRPPTIKHGQATKDHRHGHTGHDTSNYNCRRHTARTILRTLRLEAKGFDHGIVLDETATIIHEGCAATIVCGPQI